MPKIAKYRELDKVLTAKGYSISRQKGSHVQYTNSIEPITVPKHSNKEMSIGVFKSVLKKLDITIDEFWEFYRNL